MDGEAMEFIILDDCDGLVLEQFAIVEHGFEGGEMQTDIVPCCVTFADKHNR